MNRVKRVKNDNFTTISNVFLRDERLSLKAKGFLAVVMGLPEGWNFTVEGICAILKENKTAVYSAINELKKYGYCYSSRIKSEKGLFLGSDYTFFEDPNMYNHSVVYPHTENPHTDVPHTENVSQLNTYSNKVLIESNTDKEYNSVAKAPQHTKSKSKTDYEAELRKRMDSFYNELAQHVDEYGKDMVRAFFDYWSEPTQSKKKMRFEMQKTWDLKRRLAKWESNNFDKQSYGKKNELGTNNGGATGAGSQEVYTEFKVYTSEELERIGFGAPTNKSAEKYTTF